MRTLIPILLAIICLAATVRIDGVWPPEPARHQFAETVERIAQPGRLLATILSEYFGHDARKPPRPGIAQPAAMFRAVVDSQLQPDREEPTCS